MANRIQINRIGIDTIQIKRGTTEGWNLADSQGHYLKDGELGYDTTRNIIKVGKGNIPFASLKFVGEEVITNIVEDILTRIIADKYTPTATSDTLNFNGSDAATISSVDGTDDTIEFSQLTGATIDGDTLVFNI
jgi:hypothetical protein